MLGRRPSDPSTRASPPAAILNLFPGRRGISPPPPREPISPIMAPTPTIPTSPSVGRGRLHRVDGRGQQRHYHLTPSSERRTSRRSSLSCQSRRVSLPAPPRRRSILDHQKKRVAITGAQQEGAVAVGRRRGVIIITQNCVKPSKSNVQRGFPGYASALSE